MGGDQTISSTALIKRWVSSQRYFVILWLQTPQYSRVVNQQSCCLKCKLHFGRGRISTLNWQKIWSFLPRNPLYLKQVPLQVPNSSNYFSYPESTITNTYDATGSITYHHHMDAVQLNSHLHKYYLYFPYKLEAFLRV